MMDLGWWVRRMSCHGIESGSGGCHVMDLGVGQQDVM